MASQIGEFYAKISADVSGLQKGLSEANAKLNELKGKAEEAGGGKSGAGNTGLGALGNTLKNFVNPASIATAAFGALTVFMKQSVAAASESAKIDAKLGAVIKSTGGAAGVTAAAIDNLANSQMKQTGMDDEMIKNGAAVMLTFTQVGNKVFPDAMKAAMDMSAVLGTDLQGSVIQLGKALNVAAGDTAGANMGMTALRRSGVSFTDEQKKMAMEMVKTGDIMGYQKLILAELSKEFGGAASAMFEAGDKSEAVKNSWENFQEAIGQQVLPAVRETNSAFATFLDTQTENISASDRQAEAAAFVRNQYGLTFNQMRGAMAQNKEFRETVHNQANEYLRLQQYGAQWEKQLDTQTAAQGEAATDYAQLTKGALSFTKAQDDYKKSLADVNNAMKQGDYLRQQYKSQQADLKQQLKDGTITQKEYDAAAVNMYKSWADGTFQAKEQAKAMADLEAATDSQAASMFLASLQADEAFDPQKAFDFAAASGLITKEAAEQQKAFNKVKTEMAAGGLSAEDAAGAIQAISGDLSALGGMSVATFIDVYIRTHGTTDAMGGPAGGTSKNSGFDASGGSLNLTYGHASGTENSQPGIFRVGELGEEGLVVGKNGNVSVIPAMTWREMKRYGIKPSGGFALGGYGPGIEGGSGTKDEHLSYYTYQTSRLDGASLTQADQEIAIVKKDMGELSSTLQGLNALLTGGLSTDLTNRTIRQLGQVISYEFAKVTG